VEEVAEFVKEEYAKGEKVVEVGVGRQDGTARALREAGFEVTATDARDVEDDVRGVGFVRDDVSSPQKAVYEGASLVYSLRPPYEIHADLDGVAREVGADTLILPLAGEGTPLESDRDFELVNHGGRGFFVRRC
jgi:uncharacterized UPF0146 family protein